MSELLKYNPEHQGKKEPLAVIGAGVIGLSSALLAQEQGYSVTIYAKDSCNTTSTKAAASFKPHEVAYTPKTQKMVEKSWEQFGRVIHRYNGVTGVRKHTHWEASSTPKEYAQYLSVVEDFKERQSPDVPGGYLYGWQYRTYFIDTPVYMPFLKKLFKEQGGEIIDGVAFGSYNELEELPQSILINCTGMGARELADDNKVIPIKGQIAVVPSIEMDWSISADGFYVYPRSSDTVLGGTTETGIETETVDEGATHLIVRGNKRIVPYLSVDKVIRRYAGIRPFREGEVRVETESVGKKLLVHNYGHGGSGITLSWGSAEMALKLI